MVGSKAGAAAVTDPNLVNAWGLSYSPAGPFWIGDNGTGVSTVYNGSGAIIPLVVKIPAASGGSNGPTTGQVFNGSADFKIGGGSPANFIFVSEDGIVSAWNGGTDAAVVADRSAAGAVYKGLAIANDGSANFLYATNFGTNTIDVFDGTYTYTKSFTDPGIPAGFSPFGIQAIDGLLYVTYAKKNVATGDDVAGVGNGYVDVFSPTGTLVQRLVSNGNLNSPWGLAKAPTGFGASANALLVGNFGDGLIHVYDISTGAALGVINGPTGTPLAIDGLWALAFGNGGAAGPVNTLYFTAGPNGETEGLFGSVKPSP
jgi:hypothetical protein